MGRTEPKRQNRLWLSCTECRARKVKCDRARPCHRCVKGDIADQCHYDLHPRATRETAPGQLVFAAREVDGRRLRKGDTEAAAPSSESLPARIPGHSNSTSHGSQPIATAPPFTEKGRVISLQLLWHGSHSVDTYVEPLRERTISTPKEVIFGENDATVYWGRSHETNFVPRITDAAKLLLEPDKEDDVSTLYHIERSTRPRETIPIRAHDAELRNLLPSREETDKLVSIYVRRFEIFYKIIHIPTFLKDYTRLWDADPAVSDYGPPNFLAQLLGICAIGSGLVDQTNTVSSLSRSAGQWIEAVQFWLFKQDPRAQMTLGHLQAHLLMLVAGDVHWIKIDRSWISAGMLVRNAISAGLHREPSDFTRVSPFYAELRRRLWYSILEFDLQASFAKGRAPSIRDEDYDCRRPSGIIDDEILSEGVTDAQISAAESIHMTSPPLYACLANSLSLRMKVCRLVNGINLTAHYEQVLKLDAELKAFLDQAATIIQPEPDGFKRTLLNILTRRATIALHAPFLTRTLHDPRYLYSRQVCVDVATTVLADSLSLLNEPGPFATVNNICRCEISNSVFLICHELLTQAVKRRRSLRIVMPQCNGQEQILVDLVEKTAQAVASICKPDIVSQRTCAWMQLSAELSRAAVGDDAMTAISMKESIGRSVQAYRASIQQAESDNTMGSGTVDVNYSLWSTDFGNMVDEDYFNLFLNLNNLEGFNQWY
ncbi:C6 zinc finger domain-containing protein [Pleurostoma richardsiae]|uniref:C6 zinc finger domain-containing protein n=1 Tax=Pleurostoma richardsiae TaxID=41990 RepID=A0AA38RA21_9PEZI|nr:C6 zinc finger domain-containing protein [Pleurostoma richardsiae]